MRRALPLLLAVLFAVPVPAGGAVPVVFVDGKGFGHGVGMAQDGAYWMGTNGATTEDILGHFYPGTNLARATGEVRVVVVPPTAGNAVTVAFPHGGEVRDAREGQQSAGFPVAVPAGGHVRLSFDGGRYRVEGGTRAAQAGTAAPTAQGEAASEDENEGGVEAAQILDPTSSSTSSTSSTTSTSSTSSTTTTTAPPPTTTTTTPVPSSTRPLWAVPAGGVLTAVDRGRQYRGLLQATAAGSPLRLVNHVDVEAYLRGMGEVRNPRWPAAGLRAQAVAARTYALRAMSRGGELCDTQRCQVYLGVAAEYRAMDKAVADTRGQVLVYGRGFASAVYSANGGGVSASRQEGFGSPDGDQSYPYLRSAPYPTQDPGPWSVQVALSDVASRLGYPGQVTDVQVARTGPSGRALDIVLDGSAGPRAVTGIAFDRALGLRSTLFTVRIGTSDQPPPPPSGDGVLQELPDDLVAAGAAAVPGETPTLEESTLQEHPLTPPPDAPVVRRTAATDGAGVPPAATGLGLLGALCALALSAGWAVARRAGLSGRASLRF